MADLNRPGSAGVRVKQWLDGLRYRMQLAGWMRVSGLAVLAGSLLFALLVLLPQRAALEHLQQDVAHLRQAMPRHQGQWIDRSPQAALNTFYRFLPPEADAPRLVGIVLKAAAAHGIALDKAEYQLTRNQAAAYSRYQITLPIHADYVAIRSFYAQVLNALPNAALNEVSFKRDEANPQLVEARLRFTLYLSHEAVKSEK